MKISNLLKNYANKNFTPLQLNFINNNTTNKIYKLNQSKFLKEELLIRLSHRVFDLIKLPYGLPMIQPIKNVTDLYCNSFKRIYDFNIDHEKKINNFSNLLNDIKNNHSFIEEDISKGLNILKKDIDKDLINYSYINKELDKFFLSRISIRTLITQFNEINQNNNSIISNFIIEDVINDSVKYVDRIFNEVYSNCPEMKVVNNKNIKITYIPSHIFYILTELLKNSCLAHLKDSCEDKLIKIDYSDGENDIIIKISDSANSFPISKLENIMTYSYSSNPINIVDEYELTNTPIISGFGFGLPIANIHAKYFWWKNGNKSDGK